MLDYLENLARRGYFLVYAPRLRLRAACDCQDVFSRVGGSRSDNDPKWCKREGIVRTRRAFGVRR